MNYLLIHCDADNCTTIDIFDTRQEAIATWSDRDTGWSALVRVPDLDSLDAAEMGRVCGLIPTFAKLAAQDERQAKLSAIESAIANLDKTSPDQLIQDAIAKETGKAQDAIAKIERLRERESMLFERKADLLKELERRGESPSRELKLSIFKVQAEIEDARAEPESLEAFDPVEAGRKAAEIEISAMNFGRQCLEEQRRSLLTNCS